MGRFMKAVFVAACLGVIAPGSASAAATAGNPCGMPNPGDYRPSIGCATTVASLSTFEGWGSTRSSVCGKQYQIAAWRWNRGWTQTWITGATRVYVYPYATGWSWVWTSQTGWTAMQDQNLVVNFGWVGPMPGCPAESGYQYIY